MKTVGEKVVALLLLALLEVVMALVVAVYVDLVQGTAAAAGTVRARERREKKRAKTGNAQIGVERKERKGKEERDGRT